MVKLVELLREEPGGREPAVEDRTERTVRRESRL